MVKFSNAVVDAAITTHKTSSIKLGSGSDAPTISFPSFPTLEADPLLKKVALRAAFSAISPHISTVSSRTVLDAFADNLPIPLHAIDAECHLLCDTIRQAFLSPGHPALHFTAEDFLNPLGYHTTAVMNVAEREALAKDPRKCIAFVAISASAKSLSTFHPSLKQLGPIKVSYILKLGSCSIHNTSSATTNITPINLAAATLPNATANDNDDTNDTDKDTSTSTTGTHQSQRSG